ncbi:MAG: hypothetical protein DRO88_02295 [Promethearchaeia archaeon]|nr:MAG: hypothetical protein DRO88_02295 [Candidatus Lokiarchaeia archaeon]
MKKKTYLTIGILMVFCMNAILISPIFAATEWTVESGDYLLYSVKIQDASAITNEGTFNLSIDAIDTVAETMQYSIKPDLSTDTTNLAASLDVSDQQASGNNLYLSIFNVIVLYDLQTFADFKNHIGTYLKDLTSSYLELYGDYQHYRYGIKQLSYGWEIKWWDMTQEISTYQKIQYNKDGILTAYENSSLSADGKETGVKLSLQTYSGASGGIPGYSLQIISGIMLFTFAGLIWSKKRNLIKK